MSLTRRQFAKANAAAIAASVAGMPIATSASNLVTDPQATALKWHKAPCRFCGTGCGVMVATSGDRVVATHGDVKAESGGAVSLYKQIKDIIEKQQNRARLLKENAKKRVTAVANIKRKTKNLLDVRL